MSDLPGWKLLLFVLFVVVLGEMWFRRGGGGEVCVEGEGGERVGRSGLGQGTGVKVSPRDF